MINICPSLIFNKMDSGTKMQQKKWFYDYKIQRAFLLTFVLYREFLGPEIRGIEISCYSQTHDFICDYLGLWVVNNPFLQL